MASLHTCCDEMRGTLSPTLCSLCVLETHAVAHVKDRVSTYLNTGPHTDAVGSYRALPQVPVTAVSWSQVPPGSRCRRNFVLILSLLLGPCVLHTNKQHTWCKRGSQMARSCMGLNNTGICRLLGCSRTLKDGFLSSTISAPFFLLAALSKDFGREALPAHCS